MFRPGFIQPLHGITSKTRAYRVLLAVGRPLFPLLRALGPRFATTSDAVPGVTRSFDSFSAAADEAGMSRIYGGIHYDFDNTVGLDGGKKVVIQDARKREIDNKVFKYVGVAGVDKPRIVQVGVAADNLCK